MWNLSWHEYLVILSCFTSVVGLIAFGRNQDEDPTDAQAMQETLVRMTFAYWIVHCLSSFSDRIGDIMPQDFACSLRILALLSYVLTFCCVLTLPLQFIEQHYRQTD
jgi:hypothetical protein